MITVLAVALYPLLAILILALKRGVSSQLIDAWPFLVGLALGACFIQLDRWIKRFEKTRDNSRLFSQNVLFAAAWIPLSMFAMTSTRSWLGKGVVLGIGLQLSLKLWTGKQSLDWFFWPIKRVVTDVEKRWVVRAFVAAFLLATLLI